MKQLLALVLLVSVLLWNAPTQAAAPSCQSIFKKITPKVSSGSFDRKNTEQLIEVIRKKDAGEETTLLMLNSLTYELQSIKSIKGVEYYAARFLNPAVLEAVNNPHITVIYPTIVPVGRAEILHAAEPIIQKRLKENPKLKRSDLENDLLNRFITVDSGRHLEGWLVDRVLANPKAQKRIAELIAGKNVYMQVYYATKAELALAKKLGLPILASPDFNGKYSGKSGVQEILERAGASTPRAEIWLESITHYSEAVYKMWKSKNITEFMVKMEQGSSGFGNARFSLTPTLIARLNAAKNKKEALEILEASLYEQIRPEGSMSAKDFWKEFNLTQKMGALQEFRPGMISSPSVQIFVDAFGKVSVISTHEQVFHPDAPGTFTGSRSPANKIYRAQLEKEGLAVGLEMAKKGFVGFAAVDFIYTKAKDLIAIEINTRMSGTSHPQYMIRGLLDIPLSQSTNKNFYRSTDNFISEKLKTYKSVEDILNDPQIKPLLFDASTGEGVLFHNMGSFEVGKIGFTAFASTRKRSEELYLQMEALLK